MPGIMMMMMMYMLMMMYMMMMYRHHVQHDDDPIIIAYDHSIQHIIIYVASQACLETGIVGIPHQHGV